MKPIELYQLEPESVTMELGHLKGYRYDHLLEINNELWGLKNEKVEIRYYKDYCFDGRRVWQLASVWFNNYPVMIIQNAGREGDDHYRRFITDKENYMSMTSYIRSLLSDDEKNINADLVSPNDEVDKLVTFYGYTLNGKFERN